MNHFSKDIAMTSTTTRRLFSFALLSLLVSGLVACGDEPPPQGPLPDFEFSVDIRVFNPVDEPVAGIPVVLDGNVVGYTGRDGGFKATIFDSPGVEVELGIKPTDEYRARTEPLLTTQLSISQGMDGYFRGNLITHRVEVVSVSTEHFAWFEVKCDEHLEDKFCHNVPIWRDGKEVTRTDNRGFAQFSFRGVPEQTVTFQLRPSNGGDENVRIEPDRPEFEIKLGIDPAIYKASIELTDPVARLAAQRRPVRRPARPAAPRPSQPPQETAPTPPPTPPQETGPPSFF